MRVTDYYHYVSDKNFNISTEKTCLENYLLGRGQKDYEFIADICRKLGLKGIIDIGCGYGYQSEIFRKKRLKYHGIDSGSTHFWNCGKSGITFQASEYPCSVNANTKNMLAVSRFCVGDTIHDYERLAKDFAYILVDKNTEAYRGLGRVLIHVLDLSTEDEDAVTYSLFAHTETEKEHFVYCLKAEKDQQKLHVCGLQFPGEEGMLVDRMIDLLEMTGGYYYDLIPVEGKRATAYFVIDSHVYLTWEREGIVSEFIPFIREILDDTETDSRNSLYNFHGYQIYLGCM